MIEIDVRFRLPLPGGLSETEAGEALLDELMYLLTEEEATVEIIEIRGE